MYVLLKGMNGWMDGRDDLRSLCDGQTVCARFQGLWRPFVRTPRYVGFFLADVSQLRSFEKM